MQLMGKAINEVRAEEVKQLKLDGYEPILKGARWLLHRWLGNKVKLVTRQAYGFKTQEAYEIALYHNLGDLPELKMTHRFF